MPFNDRRFRDLVAAVGAFYLTDKAMRKAQNGIEATLKNGSPIDDVQRRAYLRTVQRYFTGFDREARAHLQQIDRRLENVHQVHFNLTAERGVAVRRIEATARVLNDLGALDEG